MLILTLRTDKPIAELGLYTDQAQLTYLTWQAHRELAETIHIRTREMLSSEGKNWHDLEGIVIFRGPGSFTGLRIGIAVANALSHGLKLPIIGSSGKHWIKAGVSSLLRGDNAKLISPEYGSLPRITLPRE